MEGYSEKVFLTNAILFSSGNMYFLVELFPMPITIWSKSGMLRWRISICPRVMGSKEPGKTAIFMFKINGFFTIEPWVLSSAKKILEIDDRCAYSGGAVMRAWVSRVSKNLANGIPAA